MSQSKSNYRGNRGRNNSGRNNSGGGGGRRPQLKSRGPKKENIHPSKFIKAAVPAKKDEYSAEHNFADFDLHEQLHKNIAARNFKTPSPIQDQIIPHGIMGRDVIGIANTGTGKTMAFALPLINKLMSDRSANAIVITPTRELAEQVLDECKTLTGGSRIKWALLIGGSPMGRQLQDLSRRPNLVIGTPGRIKDHIERGALKVHHYNMIVLDEVDRMLDMGFVHDMRTILGSMAKDRQSFFFSATIDPRVRSIIDEFSLNPVEISVKTSVTSDNVEQDIVHYRDEDHKLDTLHELLRGEDLSKVLIFDDTRGRVERLSKNLMQKAYSQSPSMADDRKVNENEPSAALKKTVLKF